MAMKIGQRTTLSTRPWKGVRDLTDPYAVPPDFLRRAFNYYLRSPGDGGGFAARPGFQLMNPGDPMSDVSTGRIGQGMAIATIADGTQLNFVCNGGRLYRWSPDFAIKEDVTPVAITIDPAARVYITPFSNRIVVNDDLNTPWVGTNLQASPITATNIQYSDPGAPWRAYGPCIVFDGAIIFVVRYRDTEGRVARIAWSEPDDPFTGYFQPDFDNEWDVVEANASTIYALFGTNLAVDYFRGDSIGYLSGDIGPDFRTSATRDAIDDAIGARAPASLTTFGGYIYFVDTGGRVHRIKSGGGVEPLWMQHARVVKLAPSGWDDVNARTACGTIVPELNLYLVAIWSADPAQPVVQFPTTMYAWDAATGRYVGEWIIGAGIAVHAIGALVGVNGEKILTVLGTDVAATTPQELGAGGFVWTLSKLADGVWNDNGTIPSRAATIPSLGYDPDLMLTVDQVTAIVEEIETDPTAVGIDLETE